MADPLQREPSPAGTLVPRIRSLSAAQQVKYIYKPAVSVLCLLPLLMLAAKTVGVGGESLGANPVETVLHTLGKWGLKFLVLTLAVTPLRDIFNLPRLLAFRRMLGLFAFFYVLLHFLTWLILDQGLYWPGILVDIGKRPYITIGFAALLMLVPLAVTSTNKMMRRLGRRMNASSTRCSAKPLDERCSLAWSLRATPRRLVYSRGWRPRPRRLATNPMRPLPRSAMVAGSGTGAASVATFR